MADPLWTQTKRTSGVVVTIAPRFFAMPARRSVVKRVASSGRNACTRAVTASMS